MENLADNFVLSDLYETSIYLEKKREFFALCGFQFFFYYIFPLFFIPLKANY